MTGRILSSREQRVHTYLNRHIYNYIKRCSNTDRLSRKKRTQLRGSSSTQILVPNYFVTRSDRTHTHTNNVYYNNRTLLIMYITYILVRVRQLTVYTSSSSWSRTSISGRNWNIFWALIFEQPVHSNRSRNIILMKLFLSIIFC